MATCSRFNLLIFWLLAFSTPLFAENWPAWRGPRGDGTSFEKEVPVHWGEGSNLLWRTAVPGIGHASPVVWDNKLFLVSAIPERDGRVLICFDVDSGKIAWEQTVLISPLEGKHPLNSHASSTPATDGKQVYVAFLDLQQMVVAAYDLAGKQQWLVRPGAFTSRHGFCSSPILYKNRVIVNGDHDGDSYLLALDRQTGKTIWKTPRENKTRSYCAPAIFELAQRTQMVLSGDKCVSSYDPNNGQRHWVIDGPTEQFVASLVYNPKADLLFVTGGYPDHHVLGINPHGTGNVTRTHIAWRTTRGAAYVPSPISEGDYFLIVSDQGFATCFEAATGKIQWQERVGEHHASLVSANGLVYFLSDDGVTTVVRPGPAYERVARNELKENFFASPAISQGRIFLRGGKNLYCLGMKSGRP